MPPLGAGCPATAKLTLAQPHGQRDTTVAAGATRSARFSLARLGDVAGDAAINVEVRYIYALDEHVQLATDVSKQIWYARVEPRELPVCAVAP